MSYATTAAEKNDIAMQVGANKGNQTYSATVSNAKPVSVLSTDSAQATVNSGLNKLNTLSPTTAPGYVPVPAYGTKNADGSINQFDPNTGKSTASPKAYFSNPNQQEAELTQDQLNDPSTQKFLTDNGYVQTKTEGPTVSQSGINGLDNDIAGAYKDWKSYNVDQDPAFQAKASAITSQFDQLQNEMARSNAANAAGLKTLGYRTGATQYAGSVQAGIEGEELRQAGQRISDLTLKEQSAISDARTAYQDANFKKFSTTMDALQKIRDNKKQELDDYNKRLDTALKAAQDANAQVKKDVNGILGSLQNAPQKVIDAVAASKSLGDAMTAGQGYIVNAPGIAGEYQYYVSQALAAGQVPVDFNTYQTEDANRKARIAAASQNTDRILTVDEAKALGVPFGTTAKQAFGKTPTAPATADQLKDAGYAERTLNSGAIIDSLASTVANYNPVAYMGQKVAENSVLGNTFADPDIQSMRQAQRDFVTAILRRESGAAISSGEFDTAEKQYFPQPGDSAALLAQKSKNRQIQIANLAKSAGPALSTTLGAPSTANSLIEGAKTNPLNITPTSNTNSNNPLAL